MENSGIWKFLSAFLFTALVLSWGYFQFNTMLNNSAFETLSHHRTQLRDINTQITQLNLQLQDLQNRNRALSERVEAYNMQRVRDHELAMSQINRTAAPVRTVR
jgi:type VI protein secretion system component VasK